MTTLFVQITDRIYKVTDRIGLPAKEVSRFLKFAVVGIMGAIVDFGTFNLLRIPFTNWAQTEAGTTLAITAATVISFIAAIINNFTWNRYWTYPDSRSKPLLQQLVQFAAVSVTGGVIRLPIVALTYSWYRGLMTTVFPELSETTAVVLGDNLALVTAVFTVMFWNFFVNRYWTYNDVK